MGREIRRVPPNWEHPRQACPHSPWAGGCDEARSHDGMCYRPLYDKGYQSAAEEWLQNCLQWAEGTHETLLSGRVAKDEFPYWWDWDGMPPDEDYYRPEWTPEESTAYQVYETVSEGTPVSPVFKTIDALIAWLVRQGHSEHAARQFAESGWAPSMVMHRSAVGTQIASGIDAYDLMG